MDDLLKAIALERDPEWRIRQLNRWIRPWCHREFVWEAVMETWIGTWTLNPDTPLSEDLCEQYDAIVSATILQLLLGLDGSVEAFLAGS